MKTAVFVLTMACATVAIGTPAQAQNYPWCAYWHGTGGARNCGFVSFEQCMESARGMGNDCRQNTQYEPPPGEHGSTAVPGAHPRHKSHKNS